MSVLLLVLLPFLSDAKGTSQATRAKAKAHAPQHCVPWPISAQMGGFCVDEESLFGKLWDYQYVLDAFFLWSLGQIKLGSKFKVIDVCHYQ